MLEKRHDMLLRGELMLCTALVVKNVPFLHAGLVDDERAVNGSTVVMGGAHWKS